MLRILIKLIRVEQRTSMRANISVADVRIVEWYDGLVSGVVYTPLGAFFAYLLAFAAQERRRKFILMPLSRSQTKRLESAIQSKDPSELHKSIDELGQVDQRARWTVTEPAPGQELEAQEFDDPEALKHFPPTFPCIDRAASESSVEKWLHR